MELYRKGRVIDYGSKGHPIVSDFDNHELVILKQYIKKPKVGDIINFEMYIKKDLKCGRMIYKKKETKEETVVDEKDKIMTEFNDSTGKKLGDIKRCWENNYGQKLPSNQTKGFYDGFLDIRKSILNKNYADAIGLLDKKIEYVIKVQTTLNGKTESELDFEGLLKLIEEVKNQISDFSKKNLESII